jgi:hypothetical protein
MVGVGAIGLLAACSSNAPGSAADPGGSGSTGGSSSAGAVASPSDTPAATASVSCAQITALRTALTSITSITVGARTGSQASADLKKINTALAGLAGDAGSVYADQASQLATDLSAIAEEGPALASHPSAAIMKATRTAVAAVKRTVAPVISVMRAACPPS